MKQLLAVAAVITLAAACSSHAEHSGSFVSSAATHGPIVAHTSAATDSTFCTLARQIGRDNLGLNDSAADDVDTTSMLANIDRLDAVAPAELKPDFDDFARFEHATLDPTGNPNQAGPIGGRTRSVLKHVVSYLHTACKV